MHTNANGRLPAVRQPAETDPDGSIGVIPRVRLWPRVTSIPRTGNLVIYEDCVVFTAIGHREVAWPSGIPPDGSPPDAQPRPIGQEQATVEPRRFALRIGRNLLIHRDRIERAKLVKMSGAAAVGDDLVTSVLGALAAAHSRQVLKIKLRGVRAKITIEGEWGAAETEWLRRAWGDKLAARRT